MNPYRLAPDVYFCCRGDDFVFLDLGRDEYTLVNGPTAAALRSVFRAEPSVYEEQHAAERLGELLTAGLLTTEPANSKTLAPTAIDMAVEELIDSQDLTTVPITLGNVWHFVLACATAAMKLRWSKLDRTVAGVACRKAQHTHRMIDVQRARELVSVFERLRFLFPRDFLCLFDSLALIEFLARYRIFPDWIFAIRLEPWGAHCWVQHGSAVFNETVEEAAGYTPVMSV